ncbi:hypothetical protein ACFL6I_26545, partial [candidate division KSB1 bacterium]
MHLFILQFFIAFVINSGVAGTYSDRLMHDDAAMALTRQRIQQPALSDSALVQKDISFDADHLHNVGDQFKRIFLSGILYSYKYAPNLVHAFSQFDSLIAIRPERPEGYFLKAALFSSIYRFQPTQANFDSLKYYTEKTVTTSEEMLKQYPDDESLYFYLGGVYGNIGLYYLVRNSYWNAYVNGRRGKNYLEKAVELNPDFADPYLGLGIYKYYTDVMSKLAKTFLFILGLNGNREEGIEYIKYALQHGSLTQVEAQFFL